MGRLPRPWEMPGAEGFGEGFGGFGVEMSGFGEGSGCFRLYTVGFRVYRGFRGF